MTRLVVATEAVKLRQLLGVADTELTFLNDASETVLRHLRDAVNERVFEQDRRVLKRLAALVSRAPFLAARFASRLGSLLAAGVVSEMPAKRGAAVAQRLPPEFVAEVCVYLDPRRARDLVLSIPVERIVDIALCMLQRRDYATMGRFVDILPDAAVRAVIEVVPDEADLLHAAVFMDSRNRLDHVVNMLEPERRRRVVLLALDEQADLLDEIIHVVANVNYRLKRELGDLAAAQEEAVLARIVRRAQERGLWADLLPVVDCLSLENRRKVANLSALRENPTALHELLLATDEQDLWRITLPLVELLDESTRDAFAEAGAKLPRASFVRALQVVFLAELWEPMLDMVRRMPPDKQREIAEVLRDFTGVDPQLDQKITERARQHGLGPALMAAGIQS